MQRQIYKNEAVTKIKTHSEVSKYFWMGFPIIMVETWDKRQFIPLNPKSATIPNPGIIADFMLMLTN